MFLPCFQTTNSFAPGSIPCSFPSQTNVPETPGGSVITARNDAPSLFTLTFNSPAGCGNVPSAHVNGPSNGAILTRLKPAPARRRPPVRSPAPSQSHVPPCPSSSMVPTRIRPCLSSCGAAPPADVH